MQAKKLRERGIYRLPDGREVVVSECGAGAYCLFSAATYAAFGLAEYLLDQDGRISAGGAPTGWRSEDLADTGRTAKYYVLGHSNSP